MNSKPIVLLAMLLACVCYGQTGINLNNSNYFSGSASINKGAVLRPADANSVPLSIRYQNGQLGDMIDLRNESGGGSGLPFLTGQLALHAVGGLRVGSISYFTNLTASQMVGTDANKGVVSVATTGSGSAVLATSPALAGNPTAQGVAILTNNHSAAITVSNNITIDQTHRILVGEGSSSAPALARTADTDDGLVLGETSVFYRDAKYAVGFSVSGGSGSIKIAAGDSAAPNTHEIQGTTTGALNIGTGSTTTFVDLFANTGCRGYVTPTNGVRFVQTAAAPNAATIGGAVGSVTNHMLVNVGGGLIDYWSDGSSVYSKQLAP